MLFQKQGKMSGIPESTVLVRMYRPCGKGKFLDPAAWKLFALLKKFLSFILTLKLSMLQVRGMPKSDYSRCVVRLTKL